MRLGDVIAHDTYGHCGRACLQIGGESVNVQVSREINSPVDFKILGNDPGVLKRVSAYLADLARENAGTGEVLQIIATAPKRYTVRLAMIGDLKTAFIVAFAAFGYRYALDPRLVPVRLQILNPHVQVIDGWSIDLDQTRNECYLLLLTEPLPGLVVKFGRVHVLLPWLSSPENFYSELATTYRPNEQPQLSGQYFSRWPTTLEMALDF